jgi:hypothetical protein
VDFGGYDSLFSNDKSNSYYVRAVRLGQAMPSCWTPVYESFLPRESKANDLKVLRSFRDEILGKNPVGKEYVDQLYRHSFESAVILLSNPDLGIRIQDILERLTPGIQSLLECKKMVLHREDIRRIEAVLDGVAEEASSQLSGLIWKAKKDLKNGEFLKHLGVIVED